MTTRRSLLQGAAALTACTVAPSVLAADPVAGLDYIKLADPLGLASKPIILHDFFLYLCPHCLQFAPYMERLKEELAKNEPDVQIVPVPVAWREDIQIFSRTYFALESMGKLQDLHMPFWQWCIKGDHAQWQTPDQMQEDVFAWMQNHQVDLALFQKNLNGFSTTMKVQRANRIWQSYQLTGTPGVGVAGQYLTSPEMTGTRQKAIRTIHYLINKVKHA